MTTTLQDQLQRIAAAAGVRTAKQPRGKPSLLYTFQEAADIGVHDIYGIALQGFDQLCRLDPRFQAYRKTLFSQANQTFERDQQPPEVVAKLDLSIGSFCALLSSYFLLPAAFKALEYLVRRYHVHEHNIDALMRAALPYHATPEFVRLVHILALDGTLFAFLQPMQNSGATLPRHTLVQRCLTDRAFLRFVLESGKQLGGAHVAARGAIPFHAALLCEVIASVTVVDEQFMAFLLPFVLHGLSGDATVDLRAATYMAVVQLATRTSMSADLASALTTEICKSTTPSSLPQSLLVLAHLAFTQPDLDSFPEPAFRALGKLPGLPLELAALATKGARTHRLMTLVGQAVASHVDENETYARLAEDVVAIIPPGDPALRVADALLERAASVGTEGTAGSAVCKALQALDRRHPVAAETAVNAALQRLGGSPLSSSREKLSSALQQAFAGSLRAPLLDAGATLAVAIDAASAGIRRLALERLDALAAEQDSEAEDILRGALLRRLADDDPSVVSTALGVQALLRLPPAALLDGCAGCLATAVRNSQSKDSKKDVRAAARGIARKVIKVLTGPFAEQNPEEADRIAELVLPATLSVMHARKVASTAVSRGWKVRHPLMEALKDVEMELEKSLPTAANGMQRDAAKHGGAATRNKSVQKGKEQQEKKSQSQAVEMGARGYDDASHNKIVLRALARKVAGDSSACEALGRLLTCQNGKARSFALAVAHAAMHMHGGAACAAPILLRFGALSQFASPFGAQAAGTASASEPNVRCGFDSVSGLLNDAGLEALASGALQPADLQPSVALAALNALPPEDTQGMGQSGLKRLFVDLCSLPQTIWAAHLDVLVSRARSALDAAAFLADIWGAPDSHDAPSTTARIAALRLWTQEVISSAPSSPRKGSKGRSRSSARPQTAIVEHATSADPLSMLLRLLALMASADRSLRAAALAAAARLHTEHAHWWHVVDQTAAKHLDAIAAKSFLLALGAQSAAIEADSEAIEMLVRNTLAWEAAPEVGSALSTRKTWFSWPSRGGTSQKDPAAQPATQEPPTRLFMERGQANALGLYLLEQLPRQTTVAGLACVPLLLRMMADWAPPESLVLGADTLMRSFALQGSPLRPRDLGNEGEVQALTALVEEAFIEPRILTVLTDARSSAASRSVVETLVALLPSPAPKAIGMARQAALRAITPGVFSALPIGSQRDAFLAVLSASTQDPDDACRAAAGVSLGALRLDAQMLLPMLTLVDGAGHPPGEEKLPSAAAARRKRRTSTADPAVLRAVKPTCGVLSTKGGASAGVGTLPTYTATMEALQWNENVENSIQLVPQLQNSLQVLVDATSALTGRDAHVAGTGTTAAEGDAEEDTVAARAAGSYAQQLTLVLLNALARAYFANIGESAAATLHHPLSTKTKGKTSIKGGPAPSTTLESSGRLDAALKPFDLQVAVTCAQAASLGGVSTAAMELIGTLAAAAPQAALSHVLGVVAMIGDAAAGGALVDSHSNSIAAQCLSTVAGAWTAGEQPIEQLIEAVVKAAAEAPAARRLALLSAAIAALPQVTGLAACILVLVQRQADAAAHGEGGDDDDVAGWPLDVATSLSQQVPLSVRIQALTTALEQSLAEADADPTSPIPMLTTAFTTKALQSAVISTTQGGRAPTGAAGEPLRNDELDKAYEALMQHVLSQLHHIGRLRASRGSKKPSPKLLDAATDATYGIVEGLQRLMTPAAFITSLTGLINEHTDDHVRRRALTLLTTKIQGVVESLSPKRTDTIRLAPDRSSENLHEAALKAVNRVIALLASSHEEHHAPQRGSKRPAVLPDLTLQVALGTLASLAQAIGKQHSTTFVEAIDVICGLLRSEENAAVRASALACLASIVQALGPDVLPVLPPLTQAVLQATKAATISVAGGSDDKSLSEQSEASVLELAAGLSALATMVATLGPFLAPNLPDVLAAALSPEVLSCRSARCDELAAAVRRRVSEEMPPRLLIKPLGEALEAMMNAGIEPAEELLKLLATMIVNMNARDVATYHEAAFAMILRALDLRRLSLLRAADGEANHVAVGKVEHAAVGALVELTLKLSETRFKPLFFRLVEWATSSPPPVAGLSASASVASSTLPRRVALFSAANALAERLRSVFTPYFQPLLDALLETLGSGGDNGAPAKKKRRKTATTDANGPLPAPLLRLDSLARLLAVRALHRCFVYDASEFLNASRFERLLPALVAQLHALPTSGNDSSFLLVSDVALEGGLPAEAQNSLDVAARGVVACLAAMVLASGGEDARWRPLNHAVLMATRSEQVRTRSAALEAVSAIAHALQEEYLPLLPEALPFLAELLEDEDQAVEARAAEVVKALEELSGEDLKAYLKG